MSQIYLLLADAFTSSDDILLNNRKIREQ